MIESKNDFNKEQEENDNEIDKVEADPEQPASTEEISATIDDIDIITSNEITEVDETVNQLSVGTNSDEQIEVEEASGGFKEKIGSTARMMGFKLLTGNSNPEEFSNWIQRIEDTSAGYMHNEFQPLLDKYGCDGKKLEDYFVENNGNTEVIKLPPKEILSAFRKYNSQQSAQRRNIRATNQHNIRAADLRDRFRK